MNQEIPIIKLGGPQKFSHLKWWASDPSTLRTTDVVNPLSQTQTNRQTK